jgi:hypothetical protein
MENTGKVLFEDSSPQWYIALGERWIGPLSAMDVYQKVLSQEVTWAHFVWKAGQADWKRICDVKTFQAAVPTLPAKGVQQDVKEASRPGIRTAASKVAGRRAVAPPAPGTKAKAKAEAKAEVVEEKIWFLFYNEAQFGPFSTEEISRYLRVGKIHGRVFIWQDGMADWVRLETLTSFADDIVVGKKAREDRKSSATSVTQAVTKEKKSPSKKEEQRGAPRRPLVAKILMANQDSVIVAVCRDISVGGMQVLTDRIPGVAGTRIKMNVSPAGKAAKGADKADKAIEPFVAEGVIVRILEDGRGFSFRFEKLPESSRRAIENYIQTGI